MARSSAQWPGEAFHYIWNAAEFPAGTSPETAPCFFLLPPSSPAATSAKSAAGETRLSGCRQVNFHISIWTESGVFCFVNDSTAVSVCVALAGLERQLLNKGVSGDGERKDHVSQSARWKKKRKEDWDGWFLFTDLYYCHSCLSVLDFFLLSLNALI